MGAGAPREASLPRRCRTRRAWLCGDPGSDSGLFKRKGFPGGTVARNLPADAGDSRDVGSMPGSGSSPEKGMAAQSSVLVWSIPRTEGPGGLQALGSPRVGHD